MPAPIHVVRVHPVLATKLVGLKIGEAFSDGIEARFPGPKPRSTSRACPWGGGRGRARAGSGPVARQAARGGGLVSLPTPRTSMAAHLSVNAYCKHCSNRARLGPRGPDQGRAGRHAASSSCPCDQPGTRVLVSGPSLLLVVSRGGQGGGVARICAPREPGIEGAPPGFGPEVEPLSRSGMT